MLSSAPTAAISIDGYQLIRLLGQGGAGTVYKARQLSTGQIVALKLLRRCADQDMQRDRRLTERFERETRLCAQLHHPHLVRLLDKGSAGGQLYAVFEFVPGETLKERVLRKGPLCATEAGELMGQVLDALACAHAHGIAHRDLKPQNIMITTTGVRTHAKVLDFGIAAFVPERAHGEERAVTMTQETMCSPSYSAPEQLRGEPPSVKSDLYAWGLVLLECLTGQPAVQGATLAEIFYQQLSAEEIALPAALLGHPLAALLRRVLRKNPRERAEGATAVHAEFARLNLGSIVGQLAARAAAGPAHGALTAPYHPGAAVPAYERRQITVLCCTLFLRSASEHELEASEALQRDQIGQCIDIAVRHGGHIAGALGAGLMIYYGYPQPSDSDARRAACTALELVSQARRRGLLLEPQGFQLSIRLGIHTGMVLVRPGYQPGGITPNTALLLEQAAPAGAIMASAEARRMLEPYMEFDSERMLPADPAGPPMAMYALAGEYATDAGQPLRAGAARSMLFGRGAELARLELAWRAAASGCGQSILIQGEAGIGKSRLAAQVSALARAEGYAARECRCLPEHRNDALRPFLDLVRAHWHLDEGSADGATGDSGRHERLRAALDGGGMHSPWALTILCAWLGLPLPAADAGIALSAERQKQLLLESMRALLSQLGGGRPYLLLIEDLHWIDQTSFELLTALLSASDGAAALMVLTARPEFASPLDAAVLQLGRLDEDAAGELACSLLGGARLAPGALRELLERSDGVPLFVEELTRTLVEHRLLVADDGVYRFAHGADKAAIPLTLRDLLAARLARMGPARETAQLAAAIGRTFAHALLLDVALADEASLQADLDVLVGAGLVQLRRHVQGDSYMFRHALMRDAAYDAMPRGVQRQTHARIAHRLAAGSAAEVDAAQAELARHYAAAEQFDRAVVCGNRAARVLLERALHDDAIALAGTVEQWSARLDLGPRRQAVLGASITLTNALMSKYGWANPRVLDMAERTLSLLDAGADPARRVPVLWMLAFYHHVASHRGAVRQLAGQLETLCGDDTGLQVAAGTLRGVSSWIDGDLVTAEGAFVQAIASYDPLLHAGHGYQFGLDTRVWASAGLAQVRWFAGHDEAAEADALQLARTAVAHAHALRHVPSIGVALMYLCFLHHYRGDLDNTRTTSAEMLELAGQYGLPAVQGYAAAMHGWSCSDLERTEQVLEALGRTGCMLGLSYIGSMVAQLHARAGDSHAALLRIEQSLDLCDQVEERYFKPEMLRQRAQYRGSATEEALAASRADLELAVALARAGGMGRSERTARLELNALPAAAPAPALLVHAV